LFSFVSFLVLSCCFIPKVFAENYKGIEYELLDLGDECLLQVKKDDTDLKTLNEFAKKMRDEHPNMSVVQTPLCEYTLTILEAKGHKTWSGMYSRVAEVDHVAIKWELIGHVRTPQDIKKLMYIYPFIIFDTVDESRGYYAEYRPDVVNPKYEFYGTKSGGVGVRKQTAKTILHAYRRESKRLMINFCVDPRIKQYIESVPGKRIAYGPSDYLFNMTTVYTCITPRKGITYLPISTSSSTGNVDSIK
jgi:hypothetical protein